jgi:hypothetical protein
MYRYNDFTTEKNSPREAAILEDLGSILEAGGSTITIVPEIQRKKFSKNFWNVAFSSFSTLTRSVLSGTHRKQSNSEKKHQVQGARFVPTTSYRPFDFIRAVCIANDCGSHRHVYHPLY